MLLAPSVAERTNTQQCVAVFVAVWWLRCCTRNIYAWTIHGWPPAAAVCFGQLESDALYGIVTVCPIGCSAQCVDKFAKYKVSS
jgi:hypothetical protein